MMSVVSPLSLIPRNTQGSESMVIIGAKVILTLVPEFARASYQGPVLVKFLASQQSQVLLSVWSESKNCHPWISLFPDLLTHGWGLRRQTLVGDLSVSEDHVFIDSLVP